MAFASPVVAPDPTWPSAHPDGVMLPAARTGDAATVGTTGGTSTVEVTRPEVRSADGERELAAARERLAVDHPDLDIEHLAALLDQAYAATADAKVQTYRILLAERSARAQLRRRRHPTPDCRAVG